MKKYNIKNDELRRLNECSATVFPKYTSQIINWANQNAQGIRPKNVGQMSELFPEYLEQSPAPSIEGWWEWYEDRYPNAIEVAADKIYAQVLNLKEAIQDIDYDMVRSWVEDLIINKTFTGLYVQKAILAFLANQTCESFSLATPAEEAVGIDGYVGDTPYSIKPMSYKAVGDILPENIDVRMIYYEKTSVGLTIEVGE